MLQMYVSHFAKDIKYLQILQHECKEKCLSLFVVNAVCIITDFRTRVLAYMSRCMGNVPHSRSIKKKGRYMTQSYDKSPYTQRQIQKAT